MIEIVDTIADLLEMTPEEQHTAIETLERVAKECEEVSQLFRGKGWNKIVDDCFGKPRIKQSAAYKIYELSKDIWEVIDYVCETEAEKLIEHIDQALGVIILDGFKADYIHHSCYLLSINLWQLELELLMLAYGLVQGGIE